MRVSFEIAVDDFGRIDYELQQLSYNDGRAEIFNDITTNNVAAVNIAGRIYTVEDLMKVKDNLTSVFYLMNDLDLEGVEWEAVGSDSEPFNGTFDGKGHKIYNLTVSSTEDYQGMFGYLGAVGNVIDLGLVNASVSGNRYVGGIAGHNDGIIFKSYFTGEVTATHNYVGGIAGYNDGNITSCYAEVNIDSLGINTGGIVGKNDNLVTGVYSSGNIISTSDYVGGIAGYNLGDINTMFSIANVSGNDFVGELVGRNAGQAMASFYYDSASVVYNSDYNQLGIAVDVDTMYTSEFYRTSFVLDPEDWYTASFDTFKTLPRLSYSDTKPEEQPSIELPRIEISTPTELMNITNNMAIGYILVNDIDLSGFSDWTPIGDSSVPFSGSFDGNGYSILNLTINSPSDHYQGLFGYAENAVIKNVGLVDVSINGYSSVGAVVGNGFNTRITNVFVTGSIEGSIFGTNVGGIAGKLVNSGIQDVYVHATVSGNKNVGGLVGESQTTDIKYVYSSGSVTGYEVVGGITGLSSGNITYALVISDVSGQFDTRAITGINVNDYSILKFGSYDNTFIYDGMSLVNSQYTRDHYEGEEIFITSSDLQNDTWYHETMFEGVVGISLWTIDSRSGYMPKLSNLTNQPDINIPVSSN